MIQWLNGDVQKTIMIRLMVIFAKVTRPGQSLVVVSFKQLDVQLYLASHDKPRPAGITKTDRDRKAFPQF